MKINYRQTCILVLLSQIALKFLALPSLMYIESGSDSIFGILFLMVIDGLLAFTYLDIAKQSGQRNLFEFLSDSFGRPVAKILIFVLMVKFALTIVNISKGLEYFVVDNLYNEFKWYYFALPLIAVVGFMVYKGINNIARVSEIVCWFILLGILYIAFKSMANADAGTFLPLFKEGVKPIIAGLFKYAGWFGSSTFILLLFGKIDFKKEKKMKLFTYIFIAIAVVAFVLFVFYGIFQITSPTHNFCISDISQFSSIHSSIDELSWLIVSLWIVAQAVQIAIYSYCFVQSFKFVFGIKNNTFPVMCVMALILLFSFIGEKSVGLQKIFSHPVTSVISVVAQYVVPLFVLIAALIDKVKAKKSAGKAEQDKTKPLKRTDNKKLKTVRAVDGRGAR